MKNKSALIGIMIWAMTLYTFYIWGELVKDGTHEFNYNTFWFIFPILTGGYFVMGSDRTIMKWLNKFGDILLRIFDRK